MIVVDMVWCKFESKEASECGGLSLISSSLFLMTSGCFNALEAPKDYCLAVCSSRPCDTAQRLGASEDSRRQLRSCIRLLLRPCALNLVTAARSIPGIIREAIEATVQLQATSASAACFECALLQGFRAAQAWYTTTHTSHMEDSMQILTAYDDAEHVKEG